MTPRWSFEVMRGHHYLCGHNSKQNKDSELKPTSTCLYHRDASFHMHHDLARSPLDIDQRSNFKLTFRGHQVHHSMRRAGINTMTYAVLR